MGTFTSDNTPFQCSFEMLIQWTCLVNWYVAFFTSGQRVQRQIYGAFFVFSGAGKNGDFGISMRTETLRTFWKQTRSKRENETAPPGQEVLAGVSRKANYELEGPMPLHVGPKKMKYIRYCTI